MKLNKIIKLAIKMKGLERENFRIKPIFKKNNRNPSKLIMDLNSGDSLYLYLCNPNSNNPEVDRVVCFNGTTPTKFLNANDEDFKKLLNQDIDNLQLNNDLDKILVV